MQNFWEKLRKPFVVLAPMAGYTDSAFRLLCKENGADVVVTELISADAIAYGKFKVEKIKIKTSKGELNFNQVSGKNSGTAEMLSYFDEEKPLLIQLFGKNPENFAKAAKWIDENLNVSGIDINMGCPARKVVGSDHGAALLKKPELAAEIVRAVNGNTSLPVSVKTRLGWEDDDSILEFAPVLASAGIHAITIHGRTYKDAFRGEARWENIYKVKQLLGDKVMVIGNGDLGSFGGWRDRVMKEGIALDGLAIGRAAFGKPWVFNENHELVTLNHEELYDIVLGHAELASIAKGTKGIIEFRKHLLSYLKGFPEAKKLRMEAVKIETVLDVKKILASVKEKINR